MVNTEVEKYWDYLKDEIDVVEVKFKNNKRIYIASNSKKYLNKISEFIESDKIGIDSNPIELTVRKGKDVEDQDALNVIISKFRYSRNSREVEFAMLKD